MTLVMPEITRTIIPMLQFSRPHGSQTEWDFIRRFVLPLDVWIDKFGNCIKQIGTAPILWSCHTDTVHKRQGKFPVCVDKGIVSLTPHSHQRCLGADDAAGVWLMAELIRADVPGLYIFHAAEEVGGLGSAHIAEKNKVLLNGIMCAIALDRRGKTSIITHQMGRRCCSQEFAASLANQLPKGYVSDPTGSFTDTANYVDLVGECTNLSVGYERAHSPYETLDLVFLAKLSEYLRRLDVGRLAFTRKPGDVDEVAELQSLCRDFPEIIAQLLRHHDYGSAMIKRIIRDIYGEELDI
jgi:peptidase M28-like protein